MPRAISARSRPISTDAAQPVRRAGDQLVERRALGQPAGDPHHRRSYADSDAAAACGLVAFESSTYVDAVDRRDVRDPVRAGVEGAQPARTSAGWTASRPPVALCSERASAAAARAFATLCGPGTGMSATLGQHDAAVGDAHDLLARVGADPAVDQLVTDQARSRPAGSRAA